MQQHTGAWQGVTYWAGGPWWGNYMFSIEPQNGVDKPQMGILVQHLSAPSGDYNGTPGPDTFSASGNLLHAYGNDGNDQLSVVGNQNQLSGGNGDDALSANGTNNSLHGDAGNDSLSAAGGANQLYGGTGNDGYSIDNAGDAVIENASEGSDTVYATVHFQLPANVENLVLQGGADLQGYGNGDANTITGNGGSNLLDGRGGADVMLGGAGNDVYFVDNAGDQVVENAGGGSDSAKCVVENTESLPSLAFSITSSPPSTKYTSLPAPPNMTSAPAPPLRRLLPVLPYNAFAKSLP